MELCPTWFDRSKKQADDLEPVLFVSSVIIEIDGFEIVLISTGAKVFTNKKIPTRATFRTQFRYPLE